jgi:hypothetical protein
VIFGAEKHQNLTMWGDGAAARARRVGARVLPEASEQAADYIAAFASVIDWDNVASRLDAAGKMTA